MGEEVAAVGSIEHDLHRAEPRAGELEQYLVGGVLGQRGNRVAAPDTQATQAAGHGVRPFDQVGVGHVLADNGHSYLLRMALCLLGEHPGQRLLQYVGHWGVASDGPAVPWMAPLRRSSSRSSAA